MLPLLLALPLAGTASPAGDELHDRAEALLEAGDATGVARLLADHLRRSADDPRAAELYGSALVVLERADEGAHWLEQAALAYRARGARRDASRAEKALARADPLARKRASLLAGLVRDLSRTAERLEESEQPERALELYRRLVPLARDEAATEVAAAIERIASADAVVDLDAASVEPDAAGSWPLLTLETEHYVLACDLEPAVVDQLAVTVEDVFAAFVGIYFDGDQRRAPERRVTIHIHSTWDDMADHFPGGPPSPGVQGWWSPGQAEIHAYDARTAGGSLDSTLLTLLHEGSHQFMSTFARGGTPSWLNEGTACFFEGATAMADGRVLWPDAARGRLLALAADLSAEPRRGPRVREVLAYPGPGSYPGNYYHHGWGLAYFLQQWEDPQTLEYAYRPHYLELLDLAIGRADQGLAIFEEVMLGEDSPLGHATLDDFIADWERWILEQVLPLHSGRQEDRRTRRMARAARHVGAADAAEQAGRKAVVSEHDLLLRALGDLEHVRKDIDGELARRDVLEQLTDVLERLGRKKTAAAMIELLLDAADGGEVALAEDEYSGLERRLMTLDRSNFALRMVRARTRSHTSRMLGLLETYREQQPDQVLRAYTLAASVARALGDEDELRVRADALRAEARGAGRLLGRVIAVEGPRAGWQTIFSVDPESFRVAPGEVHIAAVRPLGMIDTSVEVRGEYEVRGVLARSDERHLGTAHGLVVSGTAASDWLVVGIDEDGHVGVWTVRNSGGASARFRFVETLYLDEAVLPAAEPELAVRVRADGSLAVRVDDRPPVETEHDLELPETTHVGVFARDGAVSVRGLAVEIFP